MLSNFSNDLAEGNKGEALVISTLQEIDKAHQYINVADLISYRHKGDIIARDKTSARDTLIEVKTDTRIADTQNVLCEEAIWYKESNTFTKGFMHNQYQVFCVLSTQARTIYLIDFSILKEIYANYNKLTFDYLEQSSIVYLVPLADIRKNGALIKEIKY